MFLIWFLSNLFCCISLLLLFLTTLPFHSDVLRFMHSHTLDWVFPIISIVPDPLLIATLQCLDHFWILSQSPYHLIPWSYVQLWTLSVIRANAFSKTLLPGIQRAPVVGFLCPTMKILGLIFLRVWGIWSLVLLFRHSLVLLTECN